MDIEEYLAQKRTLEKKKENLESREKLKQKAEDTKKEFLKEVQKPVLAKDIKQPMLPNKETPNAQGPRSSSGQPDFYEPMRKMIIWNMILLFVVVVMGMVLFFALSGDREQPILIQQPQSTTTPTDQQTGTNQSNATESTQITPVDNKTEYYEGPEIDFTARDFDEAHNTGLGAFDEDGRLPGGVVLIIAGAGGRYGDLELKIVNEEASRIICFIDRTVKVDTDFDGATYELDDKDEKHLVFKLGPAETDTATDTIPGQFSQGVYEGKGRILARYDAACYYCTNDDCKTDGGDKGYDEYGETKADVVVRVSANPSAGSGSNSTNNTN